MDMSKFMISPDPPEESSLPVMSMTETEEEVESKLVTTEEEVESSFVTASKEDVEADLSC